MRNSSKLKAACLGASLITAWTATGTADANSDFMVTATCNVSTSLSSLTLIAGTLILNVPNAADGSSVLGGFNALTSVSLLAQNMPDNFPSQPWAMTGEGTGALSNDVIVCAADPSKALGQSFNSVFSGYDEATLAGQIIKRQSADVDAFLLSIEPVFGQQFGSPSTALLFSNGQSIGTVTVSVTQVPEPAATLGILLAGVAGLLRRTTRRR